MNKVDFCFSVYLHMKEFCVGELFNSQACKLRTVGGFKTTSVRLSAVFNNESDSFEICVICEATNNYSLPRLVVFKLQLYISLY